MLKPLCSRRRHISDFHPSPSVKQTIFCHFFFLSTVFWGLQEPNLTTDLAKRHFEIHVHYWNFFFFQPQSRHFSDPWNLGNLRYHHDVRIQHSKKCELSPVEDLQTFRPTTLWWKTKILLSACFSRSVLIFFFVFCSDLTSHWNSITSTTTTTTS